MKLFNSVVLLASSLVIVGCFAAAPAPSCGTVNTPLIVGTQFGIPPYDNALTTARTPSGFDVAIACELRKRLGFTAVQYKAVNPADPAVTANGTVNVVISPLNELSEERTTGTTEAFIKYADFSFGLLYNQTIPVGTTTANALQNLANIVGGRVGTLANSQETAIFNAFGGPAIAVTFPTVADALVALKNNTINAFFSSSVVVDAANASDATLKPLEDVILPTGAAFDDFRATGIGIVVNQTCCQLYVNIKQALADMLADGTYARLAKLNGVPTSFTPGADLTPAACANTQPSLVKRNAIASFIFDKFCPCNPTVVS